MSPPRLDWRLSGKANFRSRLAGATDAAKARAEWAGLADTIVAAGGEVVVCPPNPDQNLTGMLYTAEAGEFYRTPHDKPAFILPNMAVDHRRAEADWIEEFVQSIGFQTRRVATNREAPIWEAPIWEAQGDAIRGTSADEIVHTFGVGPDARTEAGSYAEVADLLSPRHVQIRFKADPWFHGNTFLNVYRAPGPEPAQKHEHAQKHLMVVCPEALADEEYATLRGFLPTTKVHEISRAQSTGYDTNALQVGQTVIAPTSLSSGTEDALASIGLEVERIDLGELFVKGGGAPVCLTNRWWGVRDDDVPGDVRWSVRPSIEAHEEG
jgi:N-dimethylarginine dimethylaminohydrolase